MAENLVRNMLATCRITAQESDLLLTALGRTAEPYIIPGNVTMSMPMVPTVAQLQAISKTFNTPELLETVLSQLPFRDILRVKTVCKAFNHSIDTSPTIQKLLFRRADKNRTFGWFPLAHLLDPCVSFNIRHHGGFTTRTIKLYFSHVPKLRRSARHRTTMHGYLIAQPPIHYCEVWIGINHGEVDAEQSWNFDLAYRQGLTVGCLLDCLDELEERLAQGLGRRRGWSRLGNAHIEIRH